MLQESGLLADVTDDTFAEVVLVEEFGEQMIIVKVNSDENPIATRTYGIMSLPTVLVFRQGEVVATIVGSKPKTYLRQALSAAMAGGEGSSTGR